MLKLIPQNWCTGRSVCQMMDLGEQAPQRAAVLLACPCVLVTALTEQQGCRGPRVARTNKTQSDRCSEAPVVH